ncbi:MAG: DUF4190 domain-containing protein [Planctomycetes bacterium]|nr:DUF4190 domain-containing protein [Planctomycetota bacterium]
MTEDNKGGFEPAPWEQKPQPKPQPPQQQPPQQGYPQQQAPQQQQPQGYAQQPMPGSQAPQGPYPTAPGGPIPAGPYGNMPPHMGHQPMSAGTSTAAIVAFVSLFVCWPVGIIAGFVALSDIKKTGKSGKGFALAGIVGGGISLLISVAAIGFFVIAVGEAQESIQESSVALEDGHVIQKRISIYYEGNENSLAVGGLQVTSGFPTGNAVVGTLKISDLVTSLDLVNPVESYRLEINGDYATIYFRDSDGGEFSVGNFYPSSSYGNNYYESDYR